MEQKEFATPFPRPCPNAAQNPDAAKPWLLIGPGIWELLLNSSPEGDKSFLQWYEPGAKSVTDEVITHTCIEEVVFLEGGLKDVSLGQEWGQGAYAYRLPGMKHETWPLCGIQQGLLPVCEDHSSEKELIIVIKLCVQPCVFELT